MRKLLYIIGVALATIGCTKENITENTSTGGEISFAAGVATRVDTDDDLVWESGDPIGLFTDQTGEDNLLFKISNISTGAMTNESEHALYTLYNDERTYYAYYPYSADQDNNLAISVDLTGGCTSPILWATTTSNDTEVDLKFTHILPKVTFNLTAGGADVRDLTGATATLKGANIKASFDIESGKFSSETTGNITLEIDVDKIVAYLIPTTSVPTNVKLWVTAGGDTYIYSLTTTTSTSATNDTWDIGSEYEYNIHVGDADIEYKKDEDIYYINSAIGLKAFADLVNGSDNSSGAITYGEGFASFGTEQPDINGKLTRDIDLSTICYEVEDGEDVSWTPIGSYLSANNSTKAFAGTFDGDGYEVKNLYINSTSSDYQGLFGYAFGVKISNLGVSGSVSGSSFVGGVVGRADSFSITNCYNTAKVSGYEYVGGLMGYMGYSTSIITNCYNTGSVIGTNKYVGGLTGMNTSKITSCYNTGSVSGTGTYIGGVAGSVNVNSVIVSCYWNSTIYTGSGLGNNNGDYSITGYSTAVMTGSEYVPGTSYYFYELLNSNAKTYNDDNPEVEACACAWKNVSGLYPILDFDNEPTALTD